MQVVVANVSKANYLEKQSLKAPTDIMVVVAMITQKSKKTVKPWQV